MSHVSNCPTCGAVDTFRALTSQIKLFYTQPPTVSVASYSLQMAALVVPLLDAALTMAEDLDARLDVLEHATHNHDGTYAPAAHDHPHNHDAQYAKPVRTETEHVQAHGHA